MSTRNLKNALTKYNKKVEKVQPEYSGKLGLTINNSQVVNVPGRYGYVYVRLLDNLSEVIQVFNDKVSAVYDFPVKITRENNRWIVVGKDTIRYPVWGETNRNTPFLPEHGGQHSLNREAKTGADPVWVYPDQFMPLLVYPSGTGAENVLIYPTVMRTSSDSFIYVGATGTTSLLPYVPTDYHTILGLVYINKNTGNPGIMVNSGTPYSGTVTDFKSVLSYLPTPDPSYEVLYAFQLPSGTATIGWDNLYNLRQFYGGSSTTSTGTASTGTVTTSPTSQFLLMGG